MYPKYLLSDKSTIDDFTIIKVCSADAFFRIMYLNYPGHIEINQLAIKSEPYQIHGIINGKPFEYRTFSQINVTEYKRYVRRYRKGVRMIDQTHSFPLKLK